MTFVLQRGLVYNFHRCSLLVTEQQKKIALRTLSRRCCFTSVVADIINQYVIVDAIEHVIEFCRLLQNLYQRTQQVLPVGAEKALIITFMELEMKRFVEMNDGVASNNNATTLKRQRE